MIITRTSAYSTLYHLVWVTKYREKIFNEEKKKHAMEELLNEVAANNEIDIKRLVVAEDHIHMVASFPPKHAISQVMMMLKGGTGRLWFLLFPETKEQLYKGELWSNGYFAGTAGEVSDEVVANYVESQLDEFNDGRPRR